MSKYPLSNPSAVRRGLLAVGWVATALLTSAITCEEIERRTESVDPMYQEDEIDVLVDYGATLQAQELTATARASGPPKAPAGSSEDVPDLPPADAPAPPPAEAPAPAPAEVRNFAGSWNSSATCEEQDAPYRWQITLNQQAGSDAVTGEISFHVCPGGGRATYALEGRATTSDTLFLEGTKTGGRGGLNTTVPSSQTFRLTKGGEPFPNFAP